MCVCVCVCVHCEMRTMCVPSPLGGKPQNANDAAKEKEEEENYLLSLYLTPQRCENAKILLFFQKPKNWKKLSDQECRFQLGVP